MTAQVETLVMTPERPSADLESVRISRSLDR
jgi:hypothetical protein